jgi:hypothetical protein
VVVAVVGAVEPRKTTSFEEEGLDSDAIDVAGADMR